MGNQNSQSYRVDGIPVNYKTYQSAATNRHVPNYSASVCAPQKRVDGVTFDIKQRPGAYIHTKDGCSPIYEVQTQSQSSK